MGSMGIDDKGADILLKALQVCVVYDIILLCSYMHNKSLWCVRMRAVPYFVVSSMIHRDITQSHICGWTGITSKYCPMDLFICPYNGWNWMIMTT